MRIISQNEDGAIIEFTKDEIGLLIGVGTEFTQGQYAPPTEEDFEDVMQTSREQVMRLFEKLP